jgi:hypothetical protein
MEFFGFPGRAKMSAPAEFLSILRPVICGFEIQDRFVGNQFTLKIDNLLPRQSRGEDLAAQIVPNNDDAEGAGHDLSESFVLELHAALCARPFAP